MEIEKLKTENDRLKVENQGSRIGSQASVSSPPPHHAHGQAQASGPGLSQHSLNLTTSESTSLGETFIFMRDDEEAPTGRHRQQSGNKRSCC